MVNDSINVSIWRLNFEIVDNELDHESKINPDNIVCRCRGISQIHLRRETMYTQKVSFWLRGLETFNLADPNSFPNCWYQLRVSMGCA